MLTLPDGQSVQSVLPDWALCELEWSIVMPAICVIALSRLAMLAIVLSQERTRKKMPISASPERQKDIGFPG